jgi:hypothetical protein
MSVFRAPRPALVRVAHLDTSDNGSALVIAQFRQRAFVPRERLAANRLLERRRRHVQRGVQLGHLRLTSFPAQFVSDAIDHGLAQVGLQRTRAVRIEVADSLERLQERILDEVLGIGKVACASRQPSPSPALERGKVPGNQTIERLSVTLADALQQVHGRFGLGRAGPRYAVFRSRQAGWLVHGVTGETPSDLNPEVSAFSPASVS